MKRVLVTGAVGFFGHHLCEHIFKNTDSEIVALVRLGKVGQLKRLTEMEDWEKYQPRIKIVWHDMRSDFNWGVSQDIGKVDTVLHIAASTHVDRSIENPLDFVFDNVVATAHLLNWTRQSDTIDTINMFSTDEVYGPAAEGVFHDESSTYNATNPYAATKAGAEQLALAYANTYDMPIFVTNTMNLFGERQDPEKFIPLVIRKLLSGDKVFIHADSTLKNPGSRHYIHCRNAADALLFLLDKFKKRGRYNIVGEVEIDNLSLAQFIADVVGKPLNYELVDFHSARPGHDLRYALDNSKLKELGWLPPKAFEKSLEKSIRWMINNNEWLRLGEDAEGV